MVANNKAASAAPPARPRVLEPEQVQHFARVMGMKVREIIDIYPDPAGGGTLVTTHDNQVSLISPDDRYLGLYKPGGVNDATPGELWTLQDFAIAAERVIINAGTGERLEVFLQKNPNQVPVRAFAHWQAIANRRNLTLAEAALRYPEAAECRRIILASGWLRPDDAAAL